MGRWGRQDSGKEVPQCPGHPRTKRMTLHKWTPLSREFIGDDFPPDRTHRTNDTPHDALGGRMQYSLPCIPAAPVTDHSNANLVLYCSRPRCLCVNVSWYALYSTR